MITHSDKILFESKIIPTKKETYKCDANLSITIPADTLNTKEKLIVKQATVAQLMLPKAYSLLATYDISIGGDNALSTPISITFTHKRIDNDFDVVAAYWNNNLGSWSPLTTMRMSNTVTCVTTKNLSTIALAYVKSISKSSYIKRKTEHFTINIPKSAKLALRKFYGSNKKALKVMDAMGYTDPSLTAEKRFAQGETRLTMDILEDVLEHLWKKYELHTPPPMIHVNLDQKAIYPRFNPNLWNYSITLPTNNYASFETMCFDLAREIFHTVQNHSSKMYTQQMYHSWLALVEATAEYAAGRVAWRQTSTDSFQTHGLKLDHKKIAKMMGSGISRNFIDVNLNYFSENNSSPWNHHQYQLSHFLDFMFSRNPNLGGFNAFWIDLKNTPYWIGSYMKPYKVFTKRGDCEFRNIYANFCEFLLFNPESPIKLFSQPPPADPKIIPLEGTSSNILKLCDAYTARYMTFKLDAKASEALSVKFSLNTDKADFAQVRFYTTTKIHQSTRVAGKTDIRTTPTSINVILKPNEYCYMIINAFSNAGIPLPVRIDTTVVTMNIVAQMNTNTPQQFKFKLNHPPFPKAPLAYQWKFEKTQKTTKTPETTHKFKSPGTFPVKVAVINRNDKNVRYGIVRTKVVIPIFLRVKVLDAKTNARISAQISMTTSNGRAIPLSPTSETATFGPILPGKRTFAFTVSAPGYHSRKIKKTMLLNKRPLYVLSIKMKKRKTR
jgi:hypothetical protein